MRRFVAGLAAAAILSGPVSAVAQQAASGVFLNSQTTEQWLARDLLLSAKVENKDGQIIGDVEDLILNANNEIEGVVLGTGGFAGLGEKRIGVAFSALQSTEKDGKRVLVLPEATKETLTALPAYERKTPAKSIIDRAMERARELTDKAVETTKEAYDATKVKATETYDAAKEKAGEAYDATKQKAGEAYDATKKKADEAYDAATKPSQPTTPSTP